jgi:hypothetical protein
MWIKKNPAIFCFQYIHFRYRIVDRFDVRELKINVIEVLAKRNVVWLFKYQSRYQEILLEFVGKISH